MNPIGQRLRSGREDKGASRVDVSHETKIAVHHLAAIEYSDFGELPDVVHVKGYVRAYAEYLGLDPTVVLKQFLEEYEAHTPATVEDPRDEVVRKMSKMLGGAQTDWSKRMRPLLIVGALALIALLVWVGWGRIGQGGSGGVETVTETVTETETPTPQQFVVIREPDTETPPATRSVVASENTESDPTPPVVASKKAEPEPTPPVVESRPATPAPAPAPSPTSDTRLSITQYGVGTGVTNLRLRGEADRFATGTKVAFFTRVKGGRTGDTIRHVWRHEGNRIASIPLRIGSANWRTYSRKTMHAGSVGTWTVEALDEAGHVLARSEFTCLP